MRITRNVIKDKVTACTRHTAKPEISMNQEQSRGEPSFYWAMCRSGTILKDCSCCVDGAENRSTAQRRIDYALAAWNTRDFLGSPSTGEKKK